MEIEVRACTPNTATDHLDMDLHSSRAINERPLLAAIDFHDSGMVRAARFRGTLSVLSTEFILQVSLIRMGPVKKFK